MTFATTVSDLSTAVSGKADIGHTHNYATSNTSYTAAQLSTNHTHNYAAATHTHNYAPTSHQHAISDVTNLQTALDGKQTSGNYATSLQLTNVANKLDGVSSSVANANIGNCGIEDVILHTESAKYVRADHIKGDLFVQQFYKTSVCATSANVSAIAQNNATVFISCTGSSALNGFYYTGKVSGVDTTGNGTTKGVVATTKTITSVATSGDTFVTPTVNAVWVSCLFYTAID